MNSNLNLPATPEKLTHDKKYQELKMERLRAAIQEGEDAIARGDYIDLKTDKELGAFFAELTMEK